jgi:hypothetical protein
MMEHDMKIDDEVQSILTKVQDGDFVADLQPIDGTELGLYLPAYVDDDTVKLLPSDYAQLETNLKVTISRNLDAGVEKGEAVAWLGNLTGKDSRCKHGDTASCTHCTYHDSVCRHCTGHQDKIGIGGRVRPVELDAPKLDYDAIPDLLKSKEDVLVSLSKRRLGLALLHGHNSVHKFTQLPSDYVSVISNGETHFRKLDEVAQDPSFVPNMWRLVDGRLQPAGGFSNR